MRSNFSTFLEQLPPLFLKKVHARQKPAINQSPTHVTARRIPSIRSYCTCFAPPACGCYLVQVCTGTVLMSTTVIEDNFNTNNPRIHLDDPTHKLPHDPSSTHPPALTNFLHVQPQPPSSPLSIHPHSPIVSATPSPFCPPALPLF